MRSLAVCDADTMQLRVFWTLSMLFCLLSTLTVPVYIQHYMCNLCSYSRVAVHLVCVLLSQFFNSCASYAVMYSNFCILCFLVTGTRNMLINMQMLCVCVIRVTGTLRNAILGQRITETLCTCRSVLSTCQAITILTTNYQLSVL